MTEELISQLTRIQNLQVTPRTDIARYKDDKKTGTKKIAKEFSCSNFGTYDEILENDNIDAVYISLPMSLHEKWVFKAARSGKHILCEKSTSLSYDSAKKIINSSSYIV